MTEKNHLIILLIYREATKMYTKNEEETCLFNMFINSNKTALSISSAEQSVRKLKMNFLGY